MITAYQFNTSFTTCKVINIFLDELNFDPRTKSHSRKIDLFIIKNYETRSLLASGQAFLPGNSIDSFDRIRCQGKQVDIDSIRLIHEVVHITEKRLEYK